MLRERSSRTILIYGAGTAVFAASLLFIGIYAAHNWDAVTALRVLGPAWIGASIGLYALSHVSTGLSWPLSLRQLGDPISLLQGLRIGLISQAGKYLPGNIAHYLGRGALAATVGINVRTSSISVAVELTSALAAALLLASFALVFDPRPLEFVPEMESGAVGIAGAIALAAVGLVAWSAKRGYSLLLFLGPTACLTVSFILSGLSLYALLLALGHQELSIAAAIGAFALAWVGGFLVPGAPAGLGVREVILVAIMGPIVGAGPALACVLLHRLITACVDGIAGLVGYVWLASTSRSKK